MPPKFAGYQAMKVTYRKLSPADSKHYRAIRLECLKAHPQNFGSTFEEQNKLPKLMFEEAIERAARDRFVIGAFDEQVLIGIGGFILSAPPEGRWPREGTIIQVYVRSTYSGRKIGLNLTRAVIREAFKMDHMLFRGPIRFVFWWEKRNWNNLLN